MKPPPRQDASKPALIGKAKSHAQVRFPITEADQRVNISQLSADKAAAIYSSPKPLLEEVRSTRQSPPARPLLRP